jgi:hypothetical protein
VPQGCGDVKPAGRIFASVGLWPLQQMRKQFILVCSQLHQIDQIVCLNHRGMCLSQIKAEEAGQQASGEQETSGVTLADADKPYSRAHKKKFRWLHDLWERDPQPELPLRPKCPASERDEDGEEVAQPHDLTKSSPAIPSTPNNTPFGQ